MRLLPPAFVLVNSIGLSNCSWLDGVSLPFVKRTATRKTVTSTTTLKVPTSQPSHSFFSDWKCPWPFTHFSKTQPTADKRDNYAPVTKATQKPSTGFNILKWWQTRNTRSQQPPPFQQVTSTTTVQPTTILQWTTPAPTSSMPVAVPVEAVVVGAGDNAKPAAQEDAVMRVPDPPVDVISESVAKHWIPRDMFSVREELRKFQLCLESCDSHLAGVVSTGSGGVALKQRQADSYVTCSETCVLQRRLPPKSPFVVTNAPVADVFFRRMVRGFNSNLVNIMLLVGVVAVLLIGYTVKKRNAIPAARRAIAQHFPVMEVYLNRLLDSEVCNNMSNWWSSVCQNSSRIGGSCSNSCRASLHNMMYKATQISEHALSARWLPDEWAVYIPWSDAAVRIAQDNAPLLSREEGVAWRGADSESGSRIDIELTVSSRQQRSGRMPAGTSGSGRTGSVRQSTGGSGSVRQSTGGSGSVRSTGGSGSIRSSAGTSGSRQLTGGSSASGKQGFAFQDKSKSGFSLVASDEVSEVEETGSDSNASST